MIHRACDQELPGKTAEAVFNGESPKGFPADLVRVARRKLRYLNAAGYLGDLRSPPGNRLEALAGNRKGQHSIRINDPVPRVLRLDRGRPGGGRDRGLSLEDEDATMAKKLKPMHPGEILREEFLVPLKLSAGALAKVCGLPRTRIERIASEQTGITADTAVRLAKALGTTEQLWLNLQNDYDVQIAKRNLGNLLDRIETVNKPKAA
jgi:addiction module HigA family antidote